MKKLFLVAISMFWLTTAFPQNQTITLTFLACDQNQNYFTIDSVFIQNTTLGCDTTIIGPVPTIILVNSTGIDDPAGNSTGSFIVSQPVPNPFNGSTQVQVVVKQGGRLNMSLFDSKGTVISQHEGDFAPGSHHFKIESTVRGFLVLKVTNGSSTGAVKLICTGSGMGRNTITYKGYDNKILKVTALDGVFSFQTGNQLSYKSMKNGYFDAIITDAPVQDTSYTFQLTHVVILPVVTTSIANNIGTYTASCGGEVLFDGYADVTERGVCWSTLPDPTIADDHTINGSGIGVFTSNLTNLTPLTPYFVRAYATNSLGTAYGSAISFTTNPEDELLTKLAGTESKTWKLLRDVSTGVYPLQVGPYDHTSIWWAMGLNNDELSIRTCMLNDEWIFYTDGTMVYDPKSDYWADGDIFESDYICQSTDIMVGEEGEDLSAWGGGTFQFELITDLDLKIKAVGHGAFIGYLRTATDYEVMDLDPMIQEEVRYNMVKLTDGTTDTLIVEVPYYFEPGEPYYGGYWRYVLVHYDNPEDEPPIPGNMPAANFTYLIDEFTVNFTNTSQYAETYQWNFGDGLTSVETNPVHVYSDEGSYTVSLTATNAFGENTIQKTLIISTTVLTEDILTGGAWKLQVTGHACYVGSGLGLDNWWIVPLANLDGTMIGTTDDWSCMTDDEFIFTTGGGYEYKTNGGSRNDGYMGAPNGCWSDAEIAASPGAPFGSCNTHTFTFTPAFGSQRAIIELTNGSGYAAFIGFMKGYYGGENADGSNPPNGGYATNRYEVIAYTINSEKETLIVSVDLSADHTGTAAWTMELERPVQVLTEEVLKAGAWKLQVSDHACYVGPALGSDAWWITPLACLDGTYAGTIDDWSCMTDDEFIFNDGGNYEYKGYGVVRNDGYFGAPNGCWDESSLSNNALYFASGMHTFEFIPASGNSRPVIILTNGVNRAAFIGFYKGYYGGENIYIDDPPNGGFATNRYEVIAYTNNGTKETLIVSVDLTADHTGTAAWTMELER